MLGAHSYCVGGKRQETIIITDKSQIKTKNRTAYTKPRGVVGSKTRDLMKPSEAWKSRGKPTLSITRITGRTTSTVR